MFFAVQMLLCQTTGMLDIKACTTSSTTANCQVPAKASVLQGKGIQDAHSCGGLDTSCIVVSFGVQHACAIVKHITATNQEIWLPSCIGDLQESGPNHYWISGTDVPYKFELGGQAHEGCAGIVALAQYLHFMAVQSPGMSHSAWHTCCQYTH